MEEEWFQGEHPLTLDAKGRVVLPKEYRLLLGPGAVLTRGTDHCLAIYPKAQFRQVAMGRLAMARRGGPHRHAARQIFAKATTVAPDGQGRIPIPATLREAVGLTREVMVAGIYDHVEIWDLEKFRESEAMAEEAPPEEEDVIW